MKPKTKVCTKCGKEKNCNDFYKKVTGKFGRQSWCKVCTAVYQKIYQKTNAEKLLKQQRRYCKNNVEKIANRKRQYHKNLYQNWKDFICFNKMKCAVCGFHTWDALEFHHNESGKKDFMIGNFMQRAFTEKNKQILLKELGKCLVLCANCHRIFHANQRQRKQKGETQ